MDPISDISSAMASSISPTQNSVPSTQTQPTPIDAVTVSNDTLDEDENRVDIDIQSDIAEPGDLLHRSDSFDSVIEVVYHNPTGFGPPPMNLHFVCGLGTPGSFCYFFIRLPS